MTRFYFYLFIYFHLFAVL